MRKVPIPDNYSAEQIQIIENLLVAVLDKPVAYHRIFATITGDLHAGIMLSQLWYWRSTKTAQQRKGEWFYKTIKEWDEEIALTRTQIDRARRILKAKNFIEEQLRGMPPKLYYRVIFHSVMIAIQNVANEA